MMMGSAHPAEVTDTNGKPNGVNNSSNPTVTTTTVSVSTNSTSVGKPVLKPQLPSLMKEEFMDPIFGPKPGGISKSKSTLVDVIVRNAVGPHNFIVQDYRQSENLKKLEATMTDFYTEYHKKNPPLDHIDVVPDGYYAAKVASHENWVRVHVVKPFNYDNPQIMLFLPDHGSYSMTDAAHLRPLKRVYVEKLPSQAYRAKLHFLGTVGSQWSTEDCKRFRNDVEGKAFCAIIVEEAQDSLFPDQIPIFSLVLIDTSGPRDIYIHHSYARKR